MEILYINFERKKKLKFIPTQFYYSKLLITGKETFISWKQKVNYRTKIYKINKNNNYQAIYLKKFKKL